MSSGTFVYDAKKNKCVVKKKPKRKASAGPALVGPTSARPQVTSSSGVLPHQVPEARKIVQERGLTGVEVLDSGEVSCSSQGKRKIGGMNGWMDVRGHTDFLGGYNTV